MKSNVKSLCSKISNELKQEYKIVDLNRDDDFKLSKDDLDKINHEWWAEEWKKIKEDFQLFFLKRIRNKTEADMSNTLTTSDKEFKETYDSIVNKFKNIDTMQPQRQRTLYSLVVGDEGVIAPKQGNYHIRKELFTKSINMLNETSEELTMLLLRKFNMIVQWVTQRMFNLPEIRIKLLGHDENHERELLQRAFDALIQRLGRPCTNLFLVSPRSQVDRIRLMEEYQIDLLILDKFFIDGTVRSRGLYDFLACGRHGEFQPEIKLDKFVLDSDKTPVDDKFKDDHVDEDDEEEYSDVSDQEPENDVDELLVKKKEEKSKPESIKDKALPSGNLQKASERMFGKITLFTPDAEFFKDICIELQQDTNEFIECMKNPVFYGSGIHRYYYQELDKLRRKFIELEDKQEWTQLVFSYINKNDPKIPIPSRAEENENRKEIVTTLKALIESSDKLSP